MAIFPSNHRFLPCPHYHDERAWPFSTEGQKKIQRPDVADERVELSGAALSGARTSVLTQNIGGMVARSSSASCSTTATRRRCLSYIAACALVAIGTVGFGMSGRRTV
jgi:hypothetical protein